MEHICNNCQIFCRPSSTCGVRILLKNKVFRDIPVNPGDNCIWEELGMADQIQQVRWFVVDEKGEPSEKGIVKIEYPSEFFGKPED